MTKDFPDFFVSLPVFFFFFNRGSSRVLLFLYPGLQGPGRQSGPLPKNWENLRLGTPQFTVCTSSGASRGAPDGVASLKVRQGAFDALKKGSGALGKVM